MRILNNFSGKKYPNPNPNPNIIFMGANTEYRFLRRIEIKHRFHK